MDKAYLRDLFWAIKAELIRFRFWVVGAFIAISFLVLLVGLIWPKNFTTTVTLVADDNKIIEPIMKGTAEVSKIDKSEKAKEFIYTRSILEAVAKKRSMFGKSATPEDEDAIIRQLRSKILVKGDKNSNYIQVNYTSSDPDQSFEVLNAIINEFIAYNEKKKREQSSNAYNFLDAQAQAYKHQLELAEDKLKEFNAKNIDGNEQTVSGRIAQLNLDVEKLKLEIEESQARVNTLQQQLGSEGQYQVAKTQVDDLRQRKSALKAQMDQLLLTYQEGYPDIVAIKAQIAELDASMKKAEAGGPGFTNEAKTENPLYEEIRKQLAVAEVDLRTQRRRMESLIRLQEEAKQQAERVASNQAEYSELTRGYDVTKKVYDDLLQKRESARISMTLDQEGQGVSYSIQEPAAFPLAPAGLGFIHFAIIGPLLALLVPLGLVVIYVIADPHLRSARVMMSQLHPDIELLGVIPHYHSPLGERLLKKDMLGILSAVIISLLVYISIAVYWQLVKG